MLRLIFRLLLVWTVAVATYCTLLVILTPSPVRRLEVPLAVLLFSIVLLVLLLAIMRRHPRPALKPFTVPEQLGGPPAPDADHPPGDSSQRQQPLPGVRGKRYSARPAADQLFSRRRDPLHEALKHAEDVHNFQEDSQLRAREKLDK